MINETWRRYRYAYALAPYSHSAPESAIVPFPHIDKISVKAGASCIIIFHSILCA